jgi:hypothetical protein
MKSNVPSDGNLRAADRPFSDAPTVADRIASADPKRSSVNLFIAESKSSPDASRALSSNWHHFRNQYQYNPNEIQHHILDHYQDNYDQEYNPIIASL